MGRRRSGAKRGAMQRSMGVATGIFARPVLEAEADAAHPEPLEREPGAIPGIEFIPGVETPPDPGTVRIRCMDWSPQRLECFDTTAVDDLMKRPRPPWASVRWINVDGLHPYVVNRFRQQFGFHTLSAEDVLHLPQRPRVEVFDDYLFIVLRMVMMVDGQLVAEQVSMFFYKDTVITFQEHGPGDVWDPVRERIRRSDAPIRHSGADFLAYALVDAVVDNGFPLIEHYGSVLDEIDAQLLDSPSTELSRRIHAVKRELLLLRRVMWPMRQLVDQLYRDEKSRFTPTTRAFLRDVYEHAVEVLDVIESYREMTSALVEMYMGAMSNRMNEVMKVLTIISTFFIPATFLAGVYGMNFDHFPELHWHYGYVGFWGICGVMTAGLLLFFRRRGWLGGRA